MIFVHEVNEELSDLDREEECLRILMGVQTERKEYNLYKKVFFWTYTIPRVVTIDKVERGI
jgi:hypothetical protein